MQGRQQRHQKSDPRGQHAAAAVVCLDVDEHREHRIVPEETDRKVRHCLGEGRRWKHNRNGSVSADEWD